MGIRWRRGAVGDRSDTAVAEQPRGAATGEAVTGPGRAGISGCCALWMRAMHPQPHTRQRPLGPPRLDTTPLSPNGGTAGCGELRSVAPADLGEAGQNPALTGMEVAVARVPMNHPIPARPRARREDSGVKLSFRWAVNSGLSGEAGGPASEGQL